MPTHKINADLDVLGEVQGTSLDINGDADISGKVVTTEIEGSSILLDSAADIDLNCDGADVILKDATTEFGRFKNDSSDFVIKSAVNDKDMIFKGVDNSSAITALTLDMSDAGTAIFNHDIKMPSGGIINFNSGDVTLTHSSNALTVAGGTFTTADLTTTGVVTLAADNHVIEDGGAFVDDSANALMNFNGGEVMVDAKLIAKKHKLSKTSSTDADADGDIVYFGSTTSMDAGKIYYFTSSGTWALADADAESTAKGMLAVALGAASDTNGMLIRGMVTLDTDPGTIGDTLFLSTTAGVATSTAPSGNGDIIRVIGYCLDSTNGQIYFNPDGTFVEVSA